MKFKSEHSTMLLRFFADVNQLGKARCVKLYIHKIQPDNKIVLNGPATGTTQL